MCCIVDSASVLAQLIISIAFLCMIGGVSSERQFIHSNSNVPTQTNTGKHQALPLAASR